MVAQRIVGLSLIVLGVLLFMFQIAGVGAESVVLLIGLTFLVAYSATRQYGFLVPAGILTGLGAGVVGAELGAADAVVPLGLGLGFVAIAVVDWAVRGRTSGFWWPFIPGGIISVAALGDMPVMRDLVPYLLPTGLVVVGLLLVFKHYGSDRGEESAASSSPSGAQDPDSPAGVRQDTEA